MKILFLLFILFISSLLCSLCTNVEESAVEGAWWDLWVLMFCIKLFQKCAADVWLHASDVFRILLSFSQAYYQCRCLNLFRFHFTCIYLGNSLRTYSPALRPSSLHLQKCSNQLHLCAVQRQQSLSWRMWAECWEKQGGSSRTCLPSIQNITLKHCVSPVPSSVDHLPAGPRKKGSHGRPKDPWDL